jgi:mannose-6-phosphate isomerase-like protein (cupin superfamily)
VPGARGSIARSKRCCGSRLRAAGLPIVPGKTLRHKRELDVNQEPRLETAHPFDIAACRDRLAHTGGGYEVVHRSPGLELGVYVLVAPEPDRQQPHEDDEVYAVLGGNGTLEVEGTNVELREGQAVFVPAGAEHRFVGYEQLSVLVIFEKR